MTPACCRLPAAAGSASPWGVRPPSAPEPSTRTGLRRAQRWLLSGLVLAGLLTLPRRAPGTIAEQRARLPSAAECESEIEGIWKSHYYFQRQNAWYEMLLTIRRTAPDAPTIAGTIDVHSWVGFPNEDQPGKCRGWLRFKVSQPAKGTYRDRKVSFGGTSHQVTEVLCGNPGRLLYNEDNFTGTIDPAIQEFQSVNNDGGDANNVPMVFRRIKCFDDPATIPSAPAPTITITPPRLFEPKSPDGGGCGVPW